MKKYFTFILFVVLGFSGLAQLKKLTFKEIKPNSCFTLRTYKINAFDELNKDYLLVKGKAPLKPEYAFIIPDKTGRHTFNTMVRTWSKRKRIAKGDETIFRIVANSILLPKEYIGAKATQNKTVINESEYILIKEYEKTYNAYENDTIEMVQLTYVKHLTEYTNELVIVDLLEINKDIDLEKCKENLNAFINHISLIKPFYNKKWDVNSTVNIPFGYNSYPTDLGYVVKNNLTKEYLPYKIDLNPGNITGGGINVGHHIYRNLWVNLGIYNYGNNSKTYDSLYRRGDYLGKIILYDTKFSSGSITSYKLNIEKRIFVGRSQSVDLIIGGNCYAPTYFSITEKTTKNGPVYEHRINYDWSYGFEFGCKYRALLFKQRLALTVGWKSLSITYKFKNYTVNEVAGDFSKAPYFLPSIKNLNVSGFEILFGVGYQFF